MRDRLLAERRSWITHALLKPTCFRGRNGLVVDTNGFAIAFALQPPPAEHPARRGDHRPVANPTDHVGRADRLADHVADRDAMLHRPYHDGQLLLSREAAPADNPADHSNFGGGVGDGHMPRTCLGPSADAGVRSEHGHFTHMKLNDRWETFHGLPLMTCRTDCRCLGMARYPARLGRRSCMRVGVADAGASPDAGGLRRPRAFLDTCPCGS